MSIPFSGTITRSGGLLSAISKQVKQINLKPVKKIVFKWDPFHEKVNQTRLFAYHLNCSKILSTNINLVVKTEVLCDRSDPTVTFTLINGDSIEFKSANLEAVEMLKLVNKHITTLVPPEVPEAEVPTTKQFKKKQGKK